MDKVRINYSKFDMKNGGKGVIAVLMYSGSGDPKIALDNAVLKLTDGIGYFELIDAHLDNPWTRVLLTDINDMVQEDLDPAKHNLKTLKNG
jgi:hypothetical protein